MKHGGKILFGIAVLAILAGMAAAVQRYAYLDFSNLKFGMKPSVSSSSQDTLVASSTSEAEPDYPDRDRHLNEARASQYLNVATRDYYNGSYEEALRRLDRAKSYDPQNYTVFKLSGQIQFERSQYRKAFNDWARASQLPNYDQSLIRDIDVLKRLIRYCRTEIDRLQKTVNHDPGDRVSVARLKELESRISE